MPYNMFIYFLNPKPLTLLFNYCSYHCLCPGDVLSMRGGTIFSRTQRGPEFVYVCKGGTRKNWRLAITRPYKAIIRPLFKKSQFLMGANHILCIILNNFLLFLLSYMHKNRLFCVLNPGFLWYLRFTWILSLAYL